MMTPPIRPRIEGGAFNGQQEENLMTATDNIVRFAPLTTHNVTLPDHLSVKVTKGNLIDDARPYGYDGEIFFGVCFIQGGRIMFSTAMPISTMLKVSKVDRAKAGSTVSEVMEKANRPKIAGHAQALRKYLLNTACVGEKFILPGMSFNFGDESTTPEDAPDAVLVIYADENEQASNGWPARFHLPRAILLDTTDGGHRGGETAAIINDGGNSFTTDQERENLRRNAVPVTIIFERKRIDAHQDFADAARAKPITGSLISTFDVRDLRNSRTIRLVESVPFLKHYVDATAANVNLSAGSLKIWSMSAARGFVSHIQDRYPPAKDGDVEKTLVEKLEGAEDFFGSVIQHMPQLHTLDLARLEADARKQSSAPVATPPVRTETPKTFRNKRGGDIALRGVGLSLLARAFIHAKEYGMSFDDVAQRLGQVDWHLLDIEKDQLPDPTTDEGRQTFAAEVKKHVLPIWGSMVIIGESRYKIGSSNEEANGAWERIKAKHFDAPQTLAAE
jgi:hypothetical protein